MLSTSDSDIRLSDRVVIRTGLPAAAGVIFLPTDASGTPGKLNTAVMSSLKLGRDMMPNVGQLGAGYYIKVHESFKLCFIVTIGDKTTERSLSENLARALRDSSLHNSQKIWIPLMGTGDGGLPLARSFEITVQVLQKATWAWNDAETTISIPDEPTEDMDELFVMIDEVRHSLAYKVSEPDWPPPFSATLKQLVAFALAPRGKRSPDELTTELLMFALGDASEAGLPVPLSLNRSALFFSAALRELAGANYKNTWAAFFGREWWLPSAPFKEHVPAMTENVRLVLVKAREIANSLNRKVVNVDDLVSALLRYEQGQWLKYIEKMGVVKEDLRAEYYDMRAGQIVMVLRNDTAGSRDDLGYASYAEAIAKFLLHAETPPPLSVSIQAPWGAGKSSLMHMIREKIDPKKTREAQKVKIGLVPDTDRLKLGSVLAFLNRQPETGNELRLKFISSRLKRRWAAESTQAHEAPLPTIKGAGQSENHLITVWFNAWMYETSEQVWAGLVDAIVTQLSERLTFKEREAFLLRLQLARIDDVVVRRKIYERIVTIWWGRVRRWAMLGVTAFAGLIGIGAVPKVLPNTPPGAIHAAVEPLTQFGFSGALVAQIILSVYLVWAYFDSRKKTIEEPAKFSLANYIKVPDYDKSIGAIHQIHADLRRVLAVTPKDAKSLEPSPIVVFIDDLDRCSPGKVASVVEGVNMLLAMEDYKCMFVIGMDPQMVAAALEKAHEDVRNKLPSYERSAPLGWRFMDKFVQLPFTIPPSRGEQLEDYLLSLGASPMQKAAAAARGANQADALPENVGLDPLPPGPDKDEGEQPPLPDLDPETERAKLALDSRDVGRIIRRATAYSFGNPRELKRMVNLARLSLALRNERRSRDPAWRSPSLNHYARWIALTLKWPDMMRWLQWGGDEVSWQAADNDQSLIVRRLKKLESLSLDANGAVTMWGSEIAVQLAIGQDATVRWMLDPKLFEFFCQEAELPALERLSHAAAVGFW